MLDNFDLENEELVKRLERDFPEYLADLYRKKGSLEKCNELLRKTYRKQGKFVDQVCLSNILFNKHEEAEKVIREVDRDTRTTEKLKLTFELSRNIKEMPFEDPDFCKYLSEFNKVFEVMHSDPKVLKFITTPYKDTKKKGDDTKKKGDERKKSNKESTFKVYGYECGTEEYQNILSDIIEYLLKYFDLNMIFIYYFILNCSCKMANCKKNCIKMGHETIKKELLEPSYLNVLGLKSLCILKELYGKDKSLEKAIEHNKLYLNNKEKKSIKLNPKDKTTLPIEETVLISQVEKPNTLATVLSKWVKSGSVRKNNKHLNACGVRIPNRIAKSIFGDKDAENYEDLVEYLREDYAEDESLKRKKVEEVLRKGGQAFYDIP